MADSGDMLLSKDKRDDDAALAAMVLLCELCESVRDILHVLQRLEDAHHALLHTTNNTADITECASSETPSILSVCTEMVCNSCVSIYRPAL